MEELEGHAAMMAGMLEDINPHKDDGKLWVPMMLQMMRMLEMPKQPSDASYDAPMANDCLHGPAKLRRIGQTSVDSNIPSCPHASNLGTHCHQRELGCGGPTER